MIRLVITDLDNTLYDWAGAYVDPLYELARVAGAALEVPAGQLLDELRAVHRLHGDVEHPGALWQTRSVRARLWCDRGAHDRSGAALGLARALQGFQAEHAARLVLYPGVRRTLADLSQRGVRLVALTDATVPNARARVEHLGLDAFLHTLYAAAPRYGAPATRAVTTEPPTDREAMAVRAVGPDRRKPDPRLLLSVCAEQGVAPDEALYVGDSLARDVAMARSAAVPHAWARYGAGLDRGARRRLARVSHYRRTDVERENLARRLARHLTPDATLHGGFAELLDRAAFAFRPHALRPHAGASETTRRSAGVTAGV